MTDLRTPDGPLARFVFTQTDGEDFAYFLHQVPGAMVYLGVANPEAGIHGIPHLPDFAADERAIGVGVRAMAGFLSSRLRA